MRLVIDVGGTFIKYAYMKEDGTIDIKDSFSSKEVATLEEFIYKVKNLYEVKNNEIKGIAVSVPGVVNPNTGVIEAITAFPYLKDIALTDLISNACNNVYVSIENDAKCAALAQVWKGNAQGTKDAVVIVFGTGIGGAVIKNQKIHYGKHYMAGEFSTMITSYNKKTGQIETLADLISTKKLCQLVADVLELEEESVNGEQVFSWAQIPAVAQVLQQFYEDIAVALYNIQYVYDPEIICIGGGISKQNCLIEGIQKAIEEIDQTKKQIVKPKVCACKYFNDANLIGAFYQHISEETYEEV